MIRADGVPPRLLTVAELTELLKASESSIYRWAAEGTLPVPKRLGQQLRWSQDEIRDWIAAGMPPQKQVAPGGDGKSTTQEIARGQ